MGENGSGKSTLLETIASAAQLPTVGAESAETDPTLAAIKKLSHSLKWSWSKKTRKGFFMRSEDFFGFAKRIAQTRSELQADLEAVDEEYRDRSDYAKGLAKMA